TTPPRRARAWALLFDAPEAHFRDFLGGELRHQGGFELVWAQGKTSLAGFALRPGRDERTLELLDDRGVVMLFADHLHMTLDRKTKRLEIFNADLRISEHLASFMGRPELTGHSVGTLAFGAHAEPPAGVTVSPEGSCPPNWTGIVDVALIDMSSVTQTERSGGRLSMTPSARLKNVGTADVPWYTKFTGSHPPHNNSQHPFLVWALYQIDGPVFRQLGVSDVKHAFLTINSNCTGCSVDSHILGLGCEDVYSQGTNTSYGSLSLRPEITAHTGIWKEIGSHFDQNGDGIQDHPPNNPDSGFDHRLDVPEAELDVAGARYFFEAWYVVRDDVNIFNTMGYREINPTQAVSGNWSFPNLTSFISGPALNTWVNPTTPPAGSANQTLDTGEGHLQLAVSTTDLGGGQTRYVYALMNHDFDRQIKSFSVPIGSGVTVSNPIFFDLDDDANNDWTVSVTANAITWTLPGGATQGLDWGTMHTFGFEANATPGPFDATLGVFEAGAPTALSIGTLGAGSNEIFSDGFESNNTSAWSAAVP
ncbi:MAG: hypothetical protein HC897_14665, partial [Thermoanaerobaculia bacterium]|nr:hypothetical protein [Thermoanaerobaculia bacterium]